MIFVPAWWFPVPFRETQGQRFPSWSILSTNETIVWANRCLLCAPELGMAKGKETVLTVIWVLHPIPNIKAKNLPALKDRTNISVKLFKYLFLKILWEHIEFATWKESSVCTFDFSQFHIFKKCSFTTSMCRRLRACFVSQLTYSYQVSYTHLSLPYPQFWLVPLSPSMELGTWERNFWFWFPSVPQNTLSY